MQINTKNGDLARDEESIEKNQYQKKSMELHLHADSPRFSFAAEMMRVVSNDAACSASRFNVHRYVWDIRVVHVSRVTKQICKTERTLNGILVFPFVKNKNLTMCGKMILYTSRGIQKNQIKLKS